MTVTAWRIVKRKHRAAAFSGEGARRFGGRWNSKGVAVVYTSASPALAVLEMLVHLQRHEILGAYLLAPISFAELFITEVTPDKLPAHWRRDPPPATLRQIGDAWVEQARSAILRVPSALIDGQCNYLLNPRHPDFRHCVPGKAQTFRFDKRLAQ